VDLWSRPRTPCCSQGAGESDDERLDGSIDLGIDGELAAEAIAAHGGGHLAQIVGEGLDEDGLTGVLERYGDTVLVAEVGKAEEHAASLYRIHSYGLAVEHDDALGSIDLGPVVVFEAGGQGRAQYPHWVVDAGIVPEAPRAPR